MADELPNNEAAPEATTGVVAPTDAPKPADKPVETLAADPGPDEGKPVGDWPADWREKLAGSNEKLMKRLQRFQSPANVLKSWQELEQRLSSGEVKTKLAEGASEEQVAAWRAENGIPEKPEGYLEKLQGVAIGDDDKPILTGFAKEMHALNAPPDVVGKAVDWYFREREAQAAAMAEGDRVAKVAAEDELRAEWGQEYRANINAITNWLSTAPDGLKDNLLAARMADGSALGNNPAALRWLAGLASDMNPAGIVAPGAGASQMQGIEAEIAKIEKLMRTDRKEYNKQEGRYRQLLDARAKMAARAA